MAAGRHVKALIAAYKDRDDLAFRRAAQAIIEDEEAKRHTALARDLRRLLSAANGWVSSEPISALVRQAPAEDGNQLGAASFFGDSYAALPEPPRDRDSAMPLAAVQVPRTTMTDLVLAEGLRNYLNQLVEEVDHWPLLDRQGIPRRNRLLLYGPPGCGKTSIASALASALGRPLVTVRVDSVVSSFLGRPRPTSGRSWTSPPAGPTWSCSTSSTASAKPEKTPPTMGNRGESLTPCCS